MTGAAVNNTLLTPNHLAKAVARISYESEPVPHGELLKVASENNRTEKDLLPLLGRPVPDINSKNPNGWTVLHYAACAGYAEACRAILAKPDFVECGAVSEFGQTALDLARNFAPGETVRVLETAVASDMQST